MQIGYPPKPNKEKVCENGENESTRFAACAMPGWRPFQEDAHNCILDYNNGPEVSFFAVYDGDGGAEMSLYLAHHFPDYLKQQGNSLLLAGPDDNSSIEAELKKLFLDFDANLREEETLKKMYTHLLPVPTDTILDTEYWLHDNSDEENVVVQPEQHGNGIGTNPIGATAPLSAFDFNTGSTACVALIFKERIVVANIGDSRAVLCRAGKALDLSTDHIATVEAEKKRIQAAGGFVDENGRVNYGLTLSRAFGLHFMKKNQELPPEEQMITAVPDVTTTPRDGAQDEFLVIASGDIWSRMSSQQLCDFVAERIGHNELQQIVKEICEHCCAKEMADGYLYGPGCDNETVILIDLKKDRRPAISSKDSSSSASMQKVEEKRSCRLCHGTDEDEDSKMQEWVQPCKCSGTLKWVHRGCFGEWHVQAPYQQRTQCSMCRWGPCSDIFAPNYFYRFSPRLKPRWFTQFDVTFQILALLAILKLVYDLARLDLHAIFTTLFMLCLLTAMEYRQQLQLLEQHKVRVQMRELRGRLLWHGGHGQQQDNGQLASSSSQSVFEESIQNAI